MLIISNTENIIDDTDAEFWSEFIYEDEDQKDISEPKIKSLNSVPLTADEITSISKDFYARTEKWEKVLKAIMVRLFKIKEEKVLASLSDRIGNGDVIPVPAGAPNRDEEWISLTAKEVSAFLKELYKKEGQIAMDKIKSKLSGTL
jgi:hypothetical protein